MKQQPAPDPLFLRLRHAVAEAQLVLFELLIWFSDKLGDWGREPTWRRELLIELRYLRQAQATLVFLAAQAELKAQNSHHGPGGTAGVSPANGASPCTTVCRRGRRRSGPTACAHRPANAPNGFSRALYTHRRRSVWRIAPAGRGLRGRIEALRDARDRFDALVARMIARLRDGARVAAYVMTRAPVDACVALALAGVSLDDSS